LQCGDHVHVVDGQAPVGVDAFALVVGDAQAVGACGGVAGAQGEFQRDDAEDVVVDVARAGEQGGVFVAEGGVTLGERVEQGAVVEGAGQGQCAVPGAGDLVVARVFGSAGEEGAGDAAADVGGGGGFGPVVEPGVGGMRGWRGDCGRAGDGTRGWERAAGGE